MSDRLAAIDNCMAELERVRKLRHLRPDALDGLMLAELDWLGELHRLLHDTTV